ncbi:acireductone dioxygenase-like [Cylas formicarius]|uniref:acireductone dioxygenase-like n=1 Tax=Cylas formicarius TaxID=197179 RepID=UPI00295888AC|nr:acireductone dioxygenase-like [Cylas formicarius]
MVRAWLVQEEKGLETKFVPLEELYKTSGVEYYQVDVDNYSSDPLLKNLVTGRGNVHQDVIEINPSEKPEVYQQEHFTSDDQLQLVLAGSAYFDVRDKYDEVIRIELLPGDLIVIPGGCFFSFTVDNKSQYKGVRYLKNASYQVYHRHSDDIPSRKEYVHKLYNGAFDQPI